MSREETRIRRAPRGKASGCPIPSEPRSMIPTTGTPKVQTVSTTRTARNTHEPLPGGGQRRLSGRRMLYATPTTARREETRTAT
ncbi:hypothetical protein E3J20_04520 [Candidatus Bathyarchaeota archaeon]|nr:MAG: hypothetical protein E3J20_04520 [Candidatus Bathyarchaeota archaeon]